MTLLEISQKIDKSRENTDTINFSSLAREFNIFADIDSHCTTQTRLKAYFIINQYAELDSDSDIGTVMYFLDDKPVCITTNSVQNYNIRIFKWFDEESMLLVKKFCINLLTNETHRFIDIDTEYPETCSFKYLGLRSTNNCIINGKSAFIKMRNDDNSVDVQFEDGTKAFFVKPKDVCFKINIKED